MSRQGVGDGVKVGTVGVVASAEHQHSVLDLVDDVALGLGETDNVADATWGRGAGIVVVFGGRRYALLTQEQNHDVSLNVSPSSSSLDYTHTSGSFGLSGLLP